MSFKFTSEQERKIKEVVKKLYISVIRAPLGECYDDGLSERSFSGSIMDHFRGEDPSTAHQEVRDLYVELGIAIMTTTQEGWKEYEWSKGSDEQQEAFDELVTHYEDEIANKLLPIVETW